MLGSWEEDSDMFGEGILALNSIDLYQVRSQKKVILSLGRKLENWLDGLRDLGV